MALSDTAIRNLKVPSKPTKISDDRGLFLLLTPSGGKLWRFKYRFDRKEKLLALGRYPDVSLAKARERREDARRLLADGIDPNAHRKIIKRHGLSRCGIHSRLWRGSGIPENCPFGRLRRRRR